MEETPKCSGSASQIARCSRLFQSCIVLETAGIGAQPVAGICSLQRKIPHKGQSQHLRLLINRMRPICEQCGIVWNASGETTTAQWGTVQRTFIITRAIEVLCLGCKLFLSYCCCCNCRDEIVPFRHCAGGGDEWWTPPASWPDMRES